MDTPAQRTIQHLWLSPLMVFVFCACLYSQTGWAESQQQGIKLAFENLPEISDGKLVTGFAGDLFASSFLFSFPVAIKALPLVTGSDAYPSSILHGPPAIICSA